MDKLISAHLSVCEASSESDSQYNTIHYHEAIKGDDYGNPPFIGFDFYLHPRDFDELMKHIQSGLIPSTVQVDLGSTRNEALPIKYGWQPDGSGKKWNNKNEENRHVQIERISFHYDLQKSVEDSDTGERLTSADIATKNARELKDGLAKLGKEVRHIGWLIIGATVLALLILH